VGIVTVYVDASFIPYRGMKMSHLAATTDGELHAMADRIGVARRWHQKPPRVSYSHYDICASKRVLAVEAGAVEVTTRELVTILRGLK
jgi:hypothetical protein